MPTLQTKCGKCRHSYSFHSKGNSHCKATGCKHGLGGARCEAFVTVEEPVSPTKG